MHGFCTVSNRAEGTFQCKIRQRVQKLLRKNHVDLNKNDGGSKRPSFETNLRLALLISGPRVRVPSIAPNNENPNLFSIGEGFGFFVFFGNESNGSSLTAVCPKPYQKKDRVTKVTTVRVP